MSHSVSRDMSWLEGCPVGGRAGGRLRVPGEVGAKTPGGAAWMRLVCVLAGAALVFATAPARAQEEAEPAKDAEVSEAGAEEAAAAADEAEAAPKEPEEKPEPKVSRGDERRRKKEEAKRRAKEEARRRDKAKRDKKAAERKKKEEREAQDKADRDAKRKAKTMGKKRRAEEERKKKEAAKAAKERVAKGEKGEDLTARLRKSQEQLEREASIKRAGVRLPPDMPLTYVWSLPLKKQVTGERILVRRDVILMVIDWTVLYCIRKSDGVPVWAIDLGGEPQFEPAVTARMVYVFVKNRLIGIDRGRGEIAWRISPSFAASAGPCVSEPTLYIPAWDKRLYAVEVRSRERVFYAGVRAEETLKTTDYDFRPVWHKTAKGHIMGTPVLTDGLIYFGAEDGYLYSVSVDGEARYRSQTQGAIRAPATAKGASVYVGSADYNAYAFDRLTGRIRWSFPTGGHVLRPIYPDIPSGVAIVTSHERGIFGVFDRSTADRGKQLWHMADARYIAGVSRDLVYLGLKGHRLAAVEKKTGLVKWISLLQHVDEVVGNTNDWTRRDDKFRLICLTESNHIVCLKEPKEGLRSVRPKRK